MLVDLAVGLEVPGTHLSVAANRRALGEALLLNCTGREDAFPDCRRRFAGLGAG